MPFRQPNNIDICWSFILLVYAVHDIFVHIVYILFAGHKVTKVFMETQLFLCWGIIDFTGPIK